MHTHQQQHSAASLQHIHYCTHNLPKRIASFRRRTHTHITHIHTSYRPSFCTRILNAFNHCPLHHISMSHRINPNKNIHSEQNRITSIPRGGDIIHLLLQFMICCCNNNISLQINLYKQSQDNQVQTQSLRTISSVTQCEQTSLSLGGVAEYNKTDPNP